jgi:hypothetical protein
MQARRAERSQVQRVEPWQVQRAEPPPQARRLVSAAARRRRCFPQSERGQQKRLQRVAQSQFYREAWS